MKKRSVIFWLILMNALLIPSELLAYYYVCIDPGHGGIHSGSVGPVYGVLEKNANLTVALALRDKIEDYVYPVFMIRTTDTTVYNDVRAWRANHANDGAPVNYFISVHHNGWPDTSRNGTETYHCNAEYTDSGDWRGTDIMYGARDSTFAKKVRLVLRDSLQHTYRCSRQILCGDTTQPCCMVCYDVLRLTTMQSTLSEASFLTNPWVEYQFYHNTDYINKEAGAICEAWWSTYLMGGLGIVKNAYSTGLGCGYEGLVGVSDYLSWNFYGIMDTVDSPYEACWLMGDYYYLQAVTPQYINGHWRTFHHSAHLLPSQEPWEDPSEIHYEPLWEIMVPSEFDYHRYVAYFSGGPYSAQVDTPNGYQNWNVGEQRNIVWDVSIGADSTSLVDVFIDREGGTGGYTEQLEDSIWAGLGGFTWTVTGDYSIHCRIKIVAYDRADNSAWDVSDWDFSISDTGNNNPEIDGHLQCKYPYEECNECKKYGESFWLEIEAHDPDGDSIYYEWYAFSLPPGHFGNGCDTMTTAENYVVYTAPAEPEAESPTEGGDADAKQQSVFLKVTVVDVRGGSNFITGYLGIYDPETSCLCGNVNDDLAVNTGDLVYFATYLFQEGPPPHDPIERADVNNDCEVNSGDLIYLATYCFGNGPPPECGWICPSEKFTESF